MGWKYLDAFVQIKNSKGSSFRTKGAPLGMERHVFGFFFTMCCSHMLVLACCQAATRACWTASSAVGPWQTSVNICRLSTTSAAAPSTATSLLSNSECVRTACGWIPLYSVHILVLFIDFQRLLLRFPDQLTKRSFIFISIVLYSRNFSWKTPNTLRHRSIRAQLCVLRVTDVVSCTISRKKKLAGDVRFDIWLVGLRFEL